MYDAQKKYDAENTIQIKLKLNMKTDADIVAKLDNVWNKQGYIKELIRKDLEDDKTYIEYRLLKFENEADETYLRDLKPGVSLDIGDARGFDDPEILQKFSSKKEAYETLATYKSSVDKWGTNNIGHDIYVFTEYAIEACEVDEDGEFVQGSDYDFSAFGDLSGIVPDSINVEEYPTNVVVHIYEAGDSDKHVRVLLDMDGLEIEEGEGAWCAEHDLETVEDDLGREIVGPAREDLLDILDNYYETMKVN